MTVQGGKVQLDWRVWIGLVGTVVVAIGGATVSQLFISAKANATQDAQIEAAAKTQDERNGIVIMTIASENNHTRELMRMQFESVLMRVQNLEERFRDIERIVQPRTNGAPFDK